MHNRFGFSSKKQDNHRPTFPTNQQFNSVRTNRVNSIGNSINSEFTPSFGVKPNQLFSFGNDTTSIRKLSTGKKFNYAASGIPSTAKSANRAMPASGLGFNSGRKSSINSVQSKLFGVTPQHSRSSYMQQNGASTSRLSRSSMGGRGGKDNRPLSDQAFHRECQEKIFGFLTDFDYPHQLTKQTLLRPSLSDVSKIFEFMFTYFQPGIVIKNGPNTSIDVVVPKMLADLGYPFQLKRSDLVSFSGGRQLGAVLESICFVIGIISYSENADVSQFNKQLDSDEFMDNLNTQIAEIALEYGKHSENEEINDIVDEHLKTLSNKFFGTKEQIEQLENEQIKLEQSLKRLEEEIAVHVELPNRIQVLLEENDSYDKYLSEVEEKDAENNKILQALLSDYKNKEATLEGVCDDEKRLSVQVESQKDIIMQYRLSVERKNQIHEEMNKENQQIQDLNENILTSTLEVNKQRAQNASFINDIEDIIVSFFNSIKSSRINQISPDFYKTFEEDKEWRAIYSQLKRYKDWDINNANDDLVREVKNFGQRFQNKFKDFKHKLLQQLSSLEGSASIELICKKQELLATLEKKRLHFAENEAELKKIVSEKETLEKDETSQLNEIRSEIDLARKNIFESEKENVSLEKQILTKEETNLEIDNVIKNKQKQFMKSIVDRIKHDEQHLKAAKKEQEGLIQVVKSDLTHKGEKLKMLYAYQNKLTNSS